MADSLPLWSFVNELAARWRCGRDSVTRMIEAEDLPAMKVRGAWRIHRDAILAREKQGLAPHASPRPKAKRRPAADAADVPDLIGAIN